MNHQVKSLKFRRTSIIILFATIGSILTLATSVISSNAVGNSPARVELSLRLFASGLEDPTSIASAGPGDGRLFVNERAGRIRIITPDGTVLIEPFLDIIDRVLAGGEEGLLGLVFHPDFDKNGYFFVNYTNYGDNIRRTRISRFKVSDNPNIADKDSEEILLTVYQPSPNHNGGDLQFGPDGYLYIPLGDGVWGGDQEGNAQNLKTLRGKIARIDVDSQVGNAAADCKGKGLGNYKIPSSNSTYPGNPYIDGPGANCDEIWASGLRNPWRMSFDSLTGDLYISDVGENDWEEINFQMADSKGGENYGWSCYEGNEKLNPTLCSDMEYMFPVFKYAHIEGTDSCSGSVTGGYVYRGRKYPLLIGRYFLVDFCQGTFWDLIRRDGMWFWTEHPDLKKVGFSAFGEDSDGKIYVANLYSGDIYRLEGAQYDEASYLPMVSN